jgi:hypothetical protein
MYINTHTHKCTLKHITHTNTPGASSTKDALLIILDRQGATSTTWIKAMENIKCNQNI